MKLETHVVASSYLAFPIGANGYVTELTTINNYIDIRTKVFSHIYDALTVTFLRRNQIYCLWSDTKLGCERVCG